RVNVLLAGTVRNPHPSLSPVSGREAFCSSGPLMGELRCADQVCVPAAASTAKILPPVDPMYTFPLTTIGAVLSEPSPLKLQSVLLVLRLTACRVEPLKKKPVDPLKAGATVALKVPSVAPVAASSTVLPTAVSRT